MKKKFMRFTSIILCIVLLFSATTVSSFAVETNKTDVSVLDSVTSVFDGVGTSGNVGDDFMKVLYNMLNNIVEFLVKGICLLYPNNSNWKNIDEYNSDEIGFLAGRENYQTAAANSNCWSLGYASKSVVPADISSGNYYLGRDLTVRKTQGVYDDMRVRAAVIDDNSGEGAVVFAAVDCLGVTSTDARTIRKAVLAYCEEQGIKVSSINITATHSHSALDTQGVSTEFFYKLIAGGVNNLLGKTTTNDALTYAESFKNYFISQSVEAIKEALADMETGSLYFSSIDCSEIVHDKRDLIAKEDIQEIASFCFVPASGSEATYISDIPCHPTSFSAGNGLVASDYIYYIDEYIKNENGGNFLMVAGALGQLSRSDVSVDETGMTEWEAMGAETKNLGYLFGEMIVDADYSTKLSPVLNVAHKEIFIEAENSILALAVEIQLVNNVAYTDGIKTIMPAEIGYIEFGNEIALALFPCELYPEVFYSTEITNGTNWDGTEWQYDDLTNSVEGVTVYPVSLANDALGYAVTDNNFAFMGHIIGEEIADETLSIGKHIASHLISNYCEMIEAFAE